MAKKRSARPKAPHRTKSILAIDIGGTNLKILATGETEPRKAPSGAELAPAEMVERVRKLASGWKYDYVSIGYPGLVGGSGPAGEPGNLGPGWVGFDFAAAFERPVRIANDAAMQALGSYDGGRMLFLGLGTGLGSVLIVQRVAVGLELGELIYKKAPLSECLGRAGLERLGKKKWRKHLMQVVPTLQRAFRADYVVLGGGNSRQVKEPLPPGVRLGHNQTAFRGGFRLWDIEDLRTLDVVDGHKEPETRIAGDWRLY
ncbi:MAG: ROK family protein [Betaproteobacteria bacterium]